MHNTKGMILLREDIRRDMINVNMFLWNNVNELVDRLHLVVSSQRACSTAYDNKILNILEELREEVCMQ
ncbi:hypothetical protein PR048_020985 [Dryococelus australis]|uniref:Uncharacterized protein n=1 Tax=Dryococelus australis TaxID=614101 RepID=A0ABQ9GWY0_9NEOP|nr:hypothetical protein PR048_020985 [Dryococelus australis]